MLLTANASQQFLVPLHTHVKTKAKEVSLVLPLADLFVSRRVSDYCKRAKNVKSASQAASASSHVVSVAG